MIRKILCVFLLGTSLVFAAPPENLSMAKRAIVHYYQSGAYNHDVTQILFPAKNYLQKRVQNNTTHKRLAIVFDIDDTTVSTYEISREYDFGFTKDALHAIWTNVRNTPVQPVLQLYNDAKKTHIALFFISGRMQNLEPVTMKLLRKSGYQNWTGLFLKPPQTKSTMAFKTRIRKKITQEGYDIVLNIGDQYSDLNGGYADMTIKLPNPLYLI